MIEFNTLDEFQPRRAATREVADLDADNILRTARLAARAAEMDKTTAFDEVSTSDPGSGAEDLSSQFRKKLDEAVTHIVNELNELVMEVERIKARIIEDGATVKEVVAGHFQLGAEALRERDRVSKRLQEIVANGSAK